MARKGYLYGGILLISAATLMFELTLTRLFAVAEWYHFAFLSVSVALFGYASSGTLLSVIPPRLRARLSRFTLLFPLSLIAAYLLINTIPFDSYQLAWAPIQIVYLVAYYLSLILPFGVSGWVIAHWLSHIPQKSSAIYAANLIGSAFGSLALLVTLPLVGGEGTVMAAASLGALGSTFLSTAGVTGKSRHRLRIWLGSALTIACSLAALAPPAWMQLRLSPYKGLSYALQTPGAHLGYQRWNVYSRVDVVESKQIHSAPGLSLNYRGRLPPQHGLTVDADNLSPISRRSTLADSEYLAYLPSSLPHLLRPQASALIIQPRGGMDIAVALYHGAARVVVVEDNPLVVQAVRDRYDSFVAGLYQDPRVVVLIEDGRSALQRGDEQFDIVQLSLAESFHPLTTGSYSLSENHLYTVESLVSALQRTNPSGLLVVTRWLQDPPSECLRAAALMVTALENLAIRSPARHLIVVRTWSTMTLLASPSPFGEGDLHAIRSACRRLGYDLVHYPGMTRPEANLYNVLPGPLYYHALQELLAAPDRRAFYNAQPYSVSPPTDDRPFFGHYFRWRQLPRIVGQFGKTWQPFGGSGFLLVLALLGVSLLASLLLILLPLLCRRDKPRRGPGPWRTVVYFAAIGLGYLFVEIPLMQQFILYLGHPALSFIIVLSALLLSSGVGSALSNRISLRGGLALLVVAIIAYPGILRVVFDHTLSSPLPARMTIAIISLLPLGLLMGIPFAGGVQRIEEIVPGLIPWIWAINGSASVVSSILSAIVALSGGYRLVLALAAACYFAATVAFWPLSQRTPVGSNQ